MKRVAVVLVLIAAACGPVLPATVDAARLSHWPLAPNTALTPGDTLPVTADQVCRPGYSASVRNVPTSRARSVFAAYHVPYSQRAAGELDHLVSLELGGSNAAANLWPEYGKRPNPKDAAENALHRAVCAGTISLADAQAQIIAWPQTNRSTG